MRIREMNRTECARVLASAPVARLACARENQPYVVPVSLAYDEASGCLYGFTTVGQKLEWMRANPLVCVEVDEVTSRDSWVSVIAMGRYEELPSHAGGAADPPRAPVRSQQSREAAAWAGDGHRRRGDEVVEDEGAVNRDQAWQILKTHPGWWEPGCSAWATRTHRDTAEPYAPVYYRIRIGGVTGHEATRDARDEIAHRGAVPAGGRWGWPGRMFRRVFGGTSKAPGTAS
jgi:uncharacterized protein